jgi:type VI secretion system secreted protein VgrG
MLKMRASSFLVLSLILLPFAQLSAYAGTIDLTTAAGFAVLAGSTVTNTGSSVITGNVGVSPGDTCTGFVGCSTTGPGTVSGTINLANTAAGNAQSALTTAYNTAAGLTTSLGGNLTGQDLGGLTLTPGVYTFNTSAQLTGTLTLDGPGVYVFQIGSTLTTASASSVVIENGAQDDNVFWQVGSSATLGTSTAFQGSILALTGITLDTGASITDGRALARNGAVTLDDNNISIPTSAPEPSSLPLLAIGLLAVSALFLWRARTPKSAR